MVDDLWTGPRPEVPVFSVVIPAYEVRTTIREAVESALRNDVPLEILVVEDGSPDPVRPDDLPVGPVCLISRHRNGGTARARNRGILMARGKWIALLDADDTYEPHRLDAVQAFVTTRPELDGVTTDTLYLVPGQPPKLLRPTPNAEGLLHFRTGVTVGALVLCRELFETVGLFDPHWQVQEDSDFWNRTILAGSEIGCLEGAAYNYRSNAGGKTLGQSPLRSLHEARDLQVAMALRPGISMNARLVLMVRAMRWHRQAIRWHWERLRNRGATE